VAPRFKTIVVASAGVQFRSVGAASSSLGWGGHNRHVGARESHGSEGDQVGALWIITLLAARRKGIAYSVSATLFALPHDMRRYTWGLHRLIAALDRWLEALTTLAYGPLPLEEYRVGLGARMG
jgi:hypothetical protein